MSAQTAHGATLALAFLLELCALAALGRWGVRVGGGPAAKLALGLGVPLLAALLWGLFAAPRAPVAVPLLRLGVQLAVFGAATAALHATGHRTLAVTFAALALANGILVRL